jgi:DNA-binding NtrC family response regulator
VRELRRICEQLALISPLPIIRAEDVERLLNANEGGNASSAWMDLKKGLPKLIEEFEAQVIRKCLEESPDMETAIQTLQVSRSSLYKKIKDYQIDPGSKS